MRTKRANKWEDNYRRLLRFVEREGHCRIPSRHKEDGIFLGRWVTHQREIRHQMPEEYRQALEEVPGWYWDGRQAKWDRAAKLMEQFIKREGHALVPARHVEDGFHLGRWVWHLRGDYRRGELSKERKKILEQFKGWVWDAKENPATVGGRPKKKGKSST